MTKPCNTCLVAPCCSDPCIEYASYVYKTSEYKAAGLSVYRNIKNMPREKAIEHILKAEKLSFFIRHMIVE